MSFVQISETAKCKYRAVHVKQCIELPSGGVFVDHHGQKYRAIIDAVNYLKSVGEIGEPCRNRCHLGQDMHSMQEGCLLVQCYNDQAQPLLWMRVEEVGDE